MEVDRAIMKVIQKRQKNWIEHVMCGDGMLKEVIEGKCEGKRGR